MIVQPVTHIEPQVCAGSRARACTVPSPALPRFGAGEGVRKVVRVTLWWSGRLARTRLIRRAPRYAFPNNLSPLAALREILSRWRNHRKNETTYTDSVACVGRSIRLRIMIRLNEEGARAEVRRRRDERRRKKRTKIGICASCEIHCAPSLSDLTPLRPGETPGPLTSRPCTAPSPTLPPLGAEEGE